MPDFLSAFSPTEWEAIGLSLRVALVATFAALPFALLAGHALARWRFPGRNLLNALLHLPLILPPVVTGYLLLVALGRQGFLGKPLDQWFGITFAFRWTGAALAAAVMGFPLLVRSIRLAIEGIDPRYEAAAATLGAAPLWRFFTIVLPLSLPGVLAGFVLAFAKALGEFGATITFVSNIPGETRTLSAAIYTALEQPGGEPLALRLTLVSIVIAVAAVLAAEWLAARSPGRASRED